MADETHKNIVSLITSSVIELQDKNNCWNVLSNKEKGYPELKHYSPVYNSTLWVLILLAEIECEIQNEKLLKPLKIISDHFYDTTNKICTIGRSHFPIPCLNGNMIYLLQYFRNDENNITENIVEFFADYQRFDDGYYKTPSEHPYYSNRSCYGKHTCYWGVVKLFKGLSFIPKNKRSKKTKQLIKKCIKFILLHEVCYSSRKKSDFLHPNIKKLTFPNMYQADYLEILWLLKRENIKSDKLNRALHLLKSNMKPNFTWKIERTIKNLIIPITKSNFANHFITKRAKEVLKFYNIKLQT